MQEEEITLELNVCLVPESSLSARLEVRSQDLGKHAECLTELESGSRRLSTHAHLTFYQLALPLSAVSKACAEVRATA